MSRGINATTKNSLALDGFSLCTLVQMDFPSPVRLTDLGRNITAFSNTFTASSHMLGIGEVSESTEVRVNSMSLELSGVEQTYVSLFLGTDYIDVWVSVWRAVLNSSGTIVGDPFLYFKGVISGYEIKETRETTTISVEVASHWKDFEKLNGRKSNHNSQQLHFAGDLGLEYGARIIKDIKWGRK